MAEAARVTRADSPVVRVPVGHVLPSDWSKFAPGPYARVPTDREAVFESYLMQRYDPTISAALTVLKQLICSRLGTYKHEDDRITDWVNAALSELRGGLRRTVSNLLSCLWAGFVVAKKNWTVGAQWRIVGLEVLHPLTFWDRFSGKPGIVYNAEAGGVIEVRQMRWKMDDEEVVYPIESVVYWPFMAELREDVFGRRLTDRARRNWYMRAKLETYWSIFLERFASPTLIMKVPAGTQPDPDTGIEVRNSTFYSKFIQSLGPGNGLAVEVSPTEQFEPFFLEASSGGDSFGAAINYHNAECFKSLMMSPLLLEDPQHSSRAQSETSLGLFTMLVEAIREELGEVLVEQICQPMLRYNFAGTPTSGRWEFEPLRSEDLSMVAQILESLNRSGVVKFTESDERAVREKFAETGLAALDEISDEERAAAAEAARMKPPGFGL